MIVVNLLVADLLVADLLVAPSGLFAMDNAISAKPEVFRPHTGLLRDISKSFDLVEAANRAAAEAAAVKAAQASATNPSAQGATLKAGEPPSNLPISILTLKSETIARINPTTKSTRRAVIKKGAHIPVVEEKPPGNGCEERWLRVMDEGWVCEDDIDLSKIPPDAPAYPVVPEGEITPWPYGFVREDTIEYRLVDGELEEVRQVLKGFGFGIDSTFHFGEEGFFKTAEGTLIPRKDAGMTGNISEFEGMALKDGKPFPLGFVRTRNAFAYSSPERSKRTRIGRVDRYKPFEIQETVGTGQKRFYRFDEGGWLSDLDVRVAQSAPLPKAIAAGEKWIDVDIDEQIITAYEGETPVYVTMVSSGRYGSPTVKGEYRIWAKIAAIAMDNTDEEEDTETSDESEAATDTDSDTAEEEIHLYSLHEVPWTQFFEESYALHGVYWHDAFGNRKSHGCVNLSPKDAAWFYKWTEPSIPNGFWAVHTTKNHPGTLIRIR
jgi:hypothetical protein